MTRVTYLHCLLAWCACCSACSWGTADVNIGFTDGAAAGGVPASPGDEPCASVWSPPVPIVELNTPEANCGGQISPDGLTFYFDSQVAGNWELFLSRRADPLAPFSSPASVTELNTGAAEADPSTTTDELEIYFTSDRDGTNCVYQALRTSSDVAWGAAQRLDQLCPSPAVGPAVSSDGLTLYYNNTGEGELVLGTVMVATRASRSEPFGGARAVPTLTQGDIAFGYPSLSPDGLTLFVTANTNELDIWMTTRDALDAEFAAPAPVDELNTPAIDGDPSITAGGSQLIFASGRAGSVDLYLSTRSCP